MPGAVLDVLLIVLVVVFAINGYRQGFVVGLLSFVGFFGGAAIGLQLGPWLADFFRDDVARVIVSLSTVFGLALLGQALANWVGVKVRRRIRNSAGRTVDDVGGAIVSITALLAVVWLVAAPLASSSLPSVARAVRTSAVLHSINAIMPQAARTLSDELRATVDTSGFPDVFGGLIPTDVRQVPEPNPALAGSPVVRALQQSIVKVEGSAPSCDRRIEGSGFVVAKERVVTNAHVVAGTHRVQVQIGGEGAPFPATVVLYDPERDLAILDVPGLDEPILTFATKKSTPDADAIVLGFPLDGSYDAEPARVRDVRPIKGPDIYNDQTVTREIYTIRGLVRSGNSGGPLVDSDGDVLGVVFAAAADDPQTGFVLTYDEVGPVIAAGRDATGRVSTGSCTD